MGQIKYQGARVLGWRVTMLSPTEATIDAVKPRPLTLPMHQLLHKHHSKPKAVSGGRIKLPPGANRFHVRKFLKSTHNDRLATDL